MNDGAEENRKDQLPEQTSGCSKDSVPANESARLAAASSTETPSETLALLSHDPSDAVKLAVARNSQTPHHIVASLANHGSLMVRAGLAADLNTPLEILNELAEDECEEVRTPAKHARRTLAASLPEEPLFNGKRERHQGSLGLRWA